VKNENVAVDSFHAYPPGLIDGGFSPERLAGQLVKAKEACLLSDKIPLLSHKVAGARREEPPDDTIDRVGPAWREVPSTSKPEELHGRLTKKEWNSQKSLNKIITDKGKVKRI
jgi:hypothetical protein